MGSKKCDRNGCERAMCSRYSREHGYICDECFKDLVQTGPNTDIERFMKSPKPPPSRKEQAKARYEAAFPLGNNK